MAVHTNFASKPLGLGREYAEQFCDASVAAAYRHRPPYPRELFNILVRLIPHDDQPVKVLDIGCGRGEVARELVARPQIARVDAIDLSPVMIEHGRALGGGDHPRLRWICCDVESAPLDPSYALITAGSSLHWMEWSIVMPRLAAALTNRGVLAIFDDNTMPAPWDSEVNRLIAQFSTNRHFEPYDLIDQLTRRGMFEMLGRQTTPPGQFSQSIGEFVEAMHSRNGFSRQRMSSAAAREFDRRLRDIVTPFAAEDVLTLRPISTITWGRPRG